MMASITETLSSDHKSCDNRFAEMEAAANDGDWARTASLFEEFRSAMERHIDFEEQTLFPAYEQATGDTGGPTQMMLIEHQDMRQFFDQLRFSVDAEDADEFLGLAETLLILLQQHNIKEEQVLYPMADEALGETEREQLLARRVE